jgi:hypothetical protein
MLEHKRMTMDAGMPRNNSTFLMRVPQIKDANNTIDWSEDVGG